MSETESLDKTPTHPLNETPAHRTRRVLSRLRLLDSSPVAMLGILVAVVALGLLMVGFFVGESASEMIRGYVDRLRELWMEP